MSDAIYEAREALCRELQGEVTNPITVSALIENLIDAKRAIIADPLPKDGMDAVADGPAPPDAGFTNEEKLVNQIKHLHERLSGEARRIADLERERDDLRHDLSETRRSSSEGTMMFARKSERLEAEVDQLRKAAAVGLHILEKALKQTSWSFALTEVHEAIRILTAALQPEPGTDPQPARGEDSTVSAPDIGSMSYAEMTSIYREDSDV